MHSAKNRSKQKISQSLHHQKKNGSVQVLQARDQNFDHSIENNSKACEQYYKLRARLTEIVKQIDTVDSQLVKKKDQNKNIYKDPRILQIKQKLKQQELVKMNYKNKIMKIKKNLENQHDLEGVANKANQLKLLEKQMQKLKQEKKTMMKIKKRQHKELYGDADNTSIKKIQTYQQEIKQIAIKNKRTLETINAKDREVRKLHEIYIIKQKRLQDITNKINNYKFDDKGNQITQQKVQQLLSQIQVLDQQRKSYEQFRTSELKILEKQKNQYKQEEKRLQRIIQEKYHQLKVAQLKYKEIIRFIQSIRAPKSFEQTNKQAQPQNNNQNQNNQKNMLKISQNQPNVSQQNIKKDNKQDLTAQIQLTKNNYHQSQEDQSIIQQNNQQQIFQISKRQKDSKLQSNVQESQYFQDFNV